MPYLSSKEVARRLGCSIRTVQHWYEQGRLPGRRFGTRGWLYFDEEDIAQWDAEGQTAVRLDRDDPLVQLWDNPADASYDTLSH